MTEPVLWEAPLSAQDWDGTFATDHLGPFAFTEALIPALNLATVLAFALRQPGFNPSAASPTDNQWSVWEMMR